MRASAGAPSGTLPATHTRTAGHELFLPDAVSPAVTFGAVYTSVYLGQVHAAS